MERSGERVSAKHIIILMIGILGASLSSIFIKYSQAPSVLTAAYRLLWTVLLMTPAMLIKADIRKELFHVKPKIFLLSAASGAFLALHFAAWFESLRHTSVASATVIVCTEVIWVALGYCLFLRGRLDIRSILAIIVTLTGSVLIAWTDFSMGGNGLYGDILALTAAFAATAYTILGRVVRGSTSNSVYTYIVYISCAAVLTAASLANGCKFFGYGGSGIIPGLLLAVFSTILGHSIFSWCLKYFSPAFVSASKLCEPVISSLLAVLLFNEIPAVLQVIGGIVVLAGMLYYTVHEVNKQDSKSSADAR